MDNMISLMEFKLDEESSNYVEEIVKEFDLMCKKQWINRNSHSTLLSPPKYFPEEYTCKYTIIFRDSNKDALAKYILENLKNITISLEKQYREVK